MSCADPTAEEVEAEIARYPLLGKANELCMDVRVPDGFELVSKRSASNSEYAFISFNYHSKLSSKSVASHFNEYFAQAGWERRSYNEGRYGAGFKSMSFQTDGAFVSVENTYPRHANFAVSCGILVERKLIYK